MIGNWLDLSSTTNRHISTYVKGFVDISGGNLILRNNNIYVNSGDISLSGVLLVGKDASFNSKLRVGGDVSLNSNLGVVGNIYMNGVSINSGFYNKTLIDSSINSGYFNKTYINSTFAPLNTPSFTGKITSAGDVSLNSKLDVSGLVTIGNDSNATNASLYVSHSKVANEVLLDFSNTNNSLNKVKFIPYLGTGGYNYISLLNDFGFIFGNSNNAATGSFVIAPHSNGLKGFKVTKDGYVGIGVVSPTQALDVSGNTKISGNVIVGNNLTLSQSFDGPITINPNSLNANKTTWTSNGVTWNVLASTNDALIFRETWEQFDSLNESTAWGTSTASYRASTPFEYTANTYATSIYFPAGSKYFGTDLTTENTYATAGFRDISGEWLQISGNKHILKSFTMINESNNAMQPALYFICGSNNGYTFYPIVNVTYSGTWGANQETEFSQLTVPTSSSVSTTSATSLAKESLNYKYHSYGYGTTAFIYFRMVIIARIGNRLGSGFNVFDGFCFFREWKPYFDTYTDTLTIQTKENNNNMVLNIKGGVKISGANSGLIIASGDAVSQGYNFIGFGYGSANGTINRWRIEEITLMRDHGRDPYNDFAVQSKLIFSTKTNGFYNNSGNDESYSYGLTLMPNNIGSGNSTNAVNVGIGTTSPSRMLDVNGSFAVGGLTTLTGNVSGIGPILKITANSASNICNSTAGNGGLDDFQSKAPFSIYDNVFNSPFGIGLKMGIWRDTGSAYIQCEGSNSGAGNICLQTYAGNVGIGTTEPLEILDIGNNSFRITTPFTLSSITPNINNGTGADSWTKFHEEGTADFATYPNNYNNAPRILRWGTATSSLLTDAGGVYPPSSAFDTSAGTAWICSTQAYAINTGLYTGIITINTLNQSKVVVTKNGEHLDIIAPSPVQLMSYTLTSRNTGNFPREFSILGSLNGSLWYLIQDVSFNATCPVADGVTTNSISLASNQTAVAFGSSTITSVIYGSNTTKKYKYFRIIIGRIYGSSNATRTGLSGWTPTFNMSTSNVKLSVDSTLVNTLRIEGGLNVTENLRIRTPLFNDSFTYNNIVRKSAFKITSGTYADDFLCIGQWAAVNDSNNPIGYIQTSWDWSGPYIYNQVLALQPLYGKVGIGTTSPQGGLHINVATNNNVAAGVTCTPAGHNISGFLPNLFLTNSSTLGTVAGNFLTHLNLSTTMGGNNQHLSIYNHRNTDGSDWLGTSLRIQSIIDATNQGYIEFNPPGVNYGIGLYTGDSTNLNSRSKGITIDANGSAIIQSSSAPQVQLKNTTAVYNGGVTCIRFQSLTNNNPMGQIECIDVASSPNTYQNDMRFFCGHNTNLVQRMVIKGISGNVGIGTTNPTQLLEVNGSIKANGSNAVINKAIVLWDGGTTDDVASATNFLGFGHNNSVLRYNVNASTTDHVFYAGSTELMRIKGTGYVGIGMNPVSPLSIKGVDYTDNPTVNGIYCVNNNTNSNSHATLSLTVNANGGNPYIGFDVVGVKGWSMGMDNADSEKFKISSVWNSVSSDTRLTITSAGNVGIGTASPNAKLQVTGSAGDFYVTAFFAAYNGLMSSGLQSAFSIYANGPIGGSSVGAHSDKRIKTNIIDIDDETSLNILRLLKPKKYNYIDKVNRSINDDFGFIAQDLKEIFPCSVFSTTEFVPNIYEIGTVSVDRTILTLTSKSINDISMNDSSVIIKFYDHTNKEIIKEIEHFIDEKSFKLKTEFEITDLSDNKIFVYGQKVDDFLSLSKDAIICITTAAIQQIDRIVLEVKETIETQQTLIQTEKAKVAILETQLTDVLARLSALENK